MGRKLIKVRTKHIKNGWQGLSKFCAVALAITEQLQCSDISVARPSIWIYKNLKGYSIKTPRSVSRFIPKFDNNKKSVKPFNFYLNIPAI